MRALLHVGKFFYLYDRRITNFLLLFLMQKEAISCLCLQKSVKRNNGPVWRVLLPDQLDIQILLRRIREVAKSGCYLRHVSLPFPLFVHMNQLGSRWTDFNEI
jgi:hypothetical protein